MFEQDINYINKLITLRQLGYNVIDNVEFEILDADTADLDTYELATNTGSVYSAI